VLERIIKESLIQLNWKSILKIKAVLGLNQGKFKKKKLLKNQKKKTKMSRKLKDKSWIKMIGISCLCLI